MGLRAENEDIKSSLWWHDFRKVCGGACEQKWFEKGMKWFGEGKKTQFWLDLWIGDASLCITFPRMFLNSTKKKVSSVIWAHGQMAYDLGILLRGGNGLLGVPACTTTTMKTREGQPTSWKMPQVDMGE